ncbi:ATP-binding cassette domain-containing protein [Thalassovita taeanensis]|uniref:ABC transporter n=1 Tax=Thalassovita taeanensis TaxID=657014 RepID=A0A1H9BYH5_9RHOB|nr:ATP-binding cassette domain-containing protein [Thalassovita taeanensis]SEP93962.1 ABC transporter [Thalassovita taeanensis]
MLLEVQHIGVAFGAVPPLRDPSLHLSRGEVLGLVGESGSGKSLTALPERKMRAYCGGPHRDGATKPDDLS